MPHVILFVSSTRGITFEVDVLFQRLYRTRLTAWKPRTTLSYNFHAYLVHFTCYEHYPCMHVIQLCSHSLRLIKIVHYARQYGAI